MPIFFKLQQTIRLTITSQSCNVVSSLMHMPTNYNLVFMSNFSISKDFRLMQPCFYLSFIVGLISTANMWKLMYRSTY